MNDGKVVVDGIKFLSALAEVFEGVRGILDSFGFVEESEMGKQLSALAGKAEAAAAPEKKEEEKQPVQAEAKKPEAPAKTEEKKKAPKFTYEQVVDIVGTKISKALDAGDKTINKKVKELVTGFGVQKLPELPAEKYEEFLAKLEEI